MNDEYPHDDSIYGTDNSIARRRFLAGVGVASLPLLAGCTAVTEREFVASPASLSTSDAEAIGYQEVNRESPTVVEQGSIAGMSTTTSVTNQIVIYEPLDENGMTFGTLSTPRGRALGQDLNPLALQDRRELLTYEPTRPFLVQVGLHGVEDGWQDLTYLGSERSAFAGGRSEFFRTYGGLLGPESDLSIVYAHVGRAQIDGNVVFGLAVRRWAIGEFDPERGYDGEEGYLSDEEYDADVETAKAAFEAIRPE